MKMLSKCDILFIDDLGKSKFQTFDGTGKAAEEFLFDLVNDRMAAMKPCVFTCNKDGETLKASMSEDRGEPFLRRLRESCVSVNFDKTSFEPKKPIQEQL
jgi:DNA replication protein DnaC